MNGNLPIRCGVGIIIADGEDWLLQRRDNKDNILWPGKVSLWGGAMELEDNSNFEAAALRELYEETGLGAEDITLTIFGTLEFDHQTVLGQAVHQVQKLFIAVPRQDIAIHVYEGENAYRLPANIDMALIEKSEFAPGVSEALYKLKNFYEYQGTP